MKYIVADSSDAFFANKTLKEVSDDMDDAVLFTEEDKKKIESLIGVADDIPQYYFIPLDVENEAFINSIIYELEEWLDIPDEEYDNLIHYIQTNCRKFIEDKVNNHNIYGQLIRSIAEDIDLDDFG